MAADAFQGARAQAAAARRRDNAVAVVLPNIPLWVPAEQAALLNQLTRQTVHLALQSAAGYISDEAPVDSGQLAQSFGADPATSTGGVEILGQDATAGINGRVFSSLPHAIVMDEGRRPGAPISREGIEAIGLWAQRKLGLSAAAAAKAKWGIAAHIVAQGIMGTGYFEQGVDRARPQIEGAFRGLGEAITAGLVRERGSKGGAA